MDDKRRDFLKKSALLGLAGLAGSLAGEEKLKALDELASTTADGKFSLPALPYDHASLEPFIDAQTMQIHHGKHHQAYIDKLNAEMDKIKVADYPSTLDDIFRNVKRVKDVIRNNAGGHYNHSLFWKLMKPNPKGESNLPQGKLAEAIHSGFRSFDDFKKEFSEKATKIFGSGWCWLILQDGKLKITTTPNQDNPLMADVADKGKPVLALDVWEHAYYLKHQNKRADYIAAWWNVINWQEAENQFVSK